MSVDREPMWPLQGVRVVALEQYIAAPFCTMWLADLGAEVIKIERPKVGEARRNYLPVIRNEKGAVYGGFLQYNRNKKSVTVDVQSEKGREIYRTLTKTADVVVENLRPGTVEKLGIGYDRLKEDNPSLIYAAISGFGRMQGFVGPYSNRPAFDAVIQAMSGIMHLIGEADGPPLLSMSGLADIFTGVVTAYAVMVALFMRERTGVGQLIDAAMYDSLVALNERAIMLYTFTGEVLTRGRESYQFPAGAFRARDGYVALIVPNDIVWSKFCTAIGRNDLIDDQRTKTGELRARNKEFVTDVLEQWMSSRTRDEIVEYLNAQGVPVGPVQTSADLAQDPQLQARKMLISVDDPVAGPLKLARSPLRMSRAKDVPTGSAPQLGQHTEEILASLGYPADEIRELREQGVI